MSKFNCKIALDNNAIKSRQDISVALHKLSLKVLRDDVFYGKIKDINGNTIGYWELDNLEDSE
jgi:hypothetical protein